MNGSMSPFLEREKRYDEKLFPVPSTRVLISSVNKYCHLTQVTNVTKWSNLCNYSCNSLWIIEKRKPGSTFALANSRIESIDEVRCRTVK